MLGRNLQIDSPEELDLGGLLLKSGLINEEQLANAVQVQKESNHQKRLGEILVQSKIITEAQLLEILAKQLQIPFVRSINDREIPEDLIKKVPTRFAKKFHILPIGYKDDAVVVVSSDPLNTTVADDIRLLLEKPIKIAAAASSVIMEAINRSYDRASTADSAIEDLGQGVIDDTALQEPVDLLDSEDEAPIIRLVNSLLFRAVKDRASDIHVEPYEREVAVRFRIDGNLYDILKIPKRLQNSVGSRIKLLGSLNIAEKRLPQDGRIRIKIAGKDVDLRLSTVPTAHGERIVLRLLDKSAVVLDLKNLGFEPAMLKQMEELVMKPFGIVLVTGPTGSGKTTTLYGALTKINREDINIITVEDPIEYQLAGVGQIQVNEKIGLTFANGLRSILRQDPDVILIGEIRDRETAEIAVQASLTGHLVLSSIHTNDASSSITRLVDMGVEPFLVSTSIIGILAQRLVRRVCTHCRVPHQATAAELARLGLEKIPSTAQVFRGVGCEYCYHTGYSGRVGIYELLPIDEELRGVILKSADAVSLRRAAIARGFKPMRYDGLNKILQGVTTIEEVLATTQEDSRIEDAI
ncbi:MAG: type II secretion system ATPase GspE [Deltaproteobacteria bacterium]|nr:type II secretion system ATPase GspE [Deltaproteobacteria bacterium]